jgi:hypothetical protein
VIGVERHEGAGALDGGADGVGVVPELTDRRKVGDAGYGHVSPRDDQQPVGADAFYDATHQ